MSAVTASQAWAEGAPVEPPLLEELDDDPQPVDPGASRPVPALRTVPPAAGGEPNKGSETANGSDSSVKSTHSAKVWKEYSGQDLHKKLFAAACTNDLKAIAKLSSIQGVDVNAAMDKRQRVLFGAAFYGHLDAVKALLNLRADVNAVDDTASSALHYACMSANNAEIVAELLAAGALPDEANAEGSTPLLLAVAHDTQQARECVTKLLDAGADANGRDGRTQTLLHHVIRTRDDPDLVFSLLEVGNAEPTIFDEAGNLAIHVAVDLNRVESIKRMVAAELSLSKSNVSGTSSFTRPTREGLTVLHLAALHGNTLLSEFLASLLADKPAVLDRLNAAGDTALHIAASEGHAGCVQALISAGADPNVLNSKGLTALHLAMAKQSVEVVEEFLIGSGPGPPLDLTIRLPVTDAPYLHFLARTGIEELISEFVSNGAPLIDLDAHGCTALHAMAHCGSDKGCRALVELGLSPATEDSDGKLPMHYAAMGGQANALQYLLQTGSNMQPHPVTLDSRTHNGRDVLFIAALAGQAEIVAMLLDLDMGDMKDVVDRDGRSALHAAAIGGDPDCALILINSGWEVDAVDFKNYTPLFLAAERGSTLVIKVLIDAGASVLSRSKASETPLHVAARKNNAEAVIALVEAGHKVDAVDNRKRTPCHEAAYHGSLLAGIALVRLGADIEATEQYGLTPVAAAVSAGHRPMAKALEDEACRSADYNDRENIALAYRIAGPAPIQDLPDDIDDVPPMVGPPPSRGSARSKGLRDENSGFIRGKSPLSGARRRRRSSTAISNEESAEFSRPGSRASVLGQGRPHSTEEGSEDMDNARGDSAGVGKRKGSRLRGDPSDQNADGNGEDDETDEDDMDPAIREVLRKMEANLAGEDLDDEVMSLGSSLGSDYQYEAVSKAAVETLKSVSDANNWEM